MSYYKTTFSIDVLSDELLPDFISLEQIFYEISEGHCVGYNLRSKTVDLTPKKTVKALYEAGSEPGFFNLDDNGNPTGETYV